MLYGILITLFVFVCLFLIFIILLQKGKSSMGLGNLGGSTQMLFGGSGGQDVFQKATWVLGVIFMVGSLALAMMKRPSTSDLITRLGSQQVAMPQVSAPEAEPVNTQEAPKAE